MKQLISVAADAVVLKNEKIVLVQREEPIFNGAWALPGGFVEIEETVEEACVRELREETGLNGTIQSLIGVYSDPGRDPRGRVISVAYRVAVQKTNIGQSAQWFDVNMLPKLAFDHEQIIEDVRKQAMGIGAKV